MHTESVVYRPPPERYIETVQTFHVGDVIRKARGARRWNQERLGKEAEKFPLGDQVLPIDKGTVSKVERHPYGSKFGTVWRLMAALSLTLADVERDVDPPQRKEEAQKRRPVSAASGTR